MVKKIIKLSGTLFLIAFITTGLLAYVNYITRDIIEVNTTASENKARAELIEADSFKDLGDGVFEAVSNGETQGYCVDVIPTSKYGGDIKMIIGISEDMTVTGIKIINHNETPGLGANATKPEFSEKLKEKKYPVKVNKNGNSNDNQIDAISGATLTSMAVADGINMAFERLDLLRKVGE